MHISASLPSFGCFFLVFSLSLGQTILRPWPAWVDFHFILIGFFGNAVYSFFHVFKFLFFLRRGSCHHGGEGRTSFKPSQCPLLMLSRSKHSAVIFCLPWKVDASRQGAAGITLQLSTHAGLVHRKGIRNRKGWMYERVDTFYLLKVATLAILCCSAAHRWMKMGDKLWLNAI